MRVLAENLGRLARDGRCAQAALGLSVHPTQTELGMHHRAGSQTVFRARRLRQLSLGDSLSFSLIRDRSTGFMIDCHHSNRRLAVWSED
jgi:hypothetical protein